MLNQQVLRQFDWLFVGAMVVLTLLGVAFIWSTTHWQPVYAAMAQKQLRWLLISLAAFAAVLFFDYARLGVLTYPAYFLVLLALVLVLIPGVGVMRNSARRWLSFGGLDLQPSELAKVAVVLALARYLMYRKNCRRWQGLIAPFLIALVPMVLILREPDLGTAMLFIPTLFVMLYAAGASPKHLGAIAGAGVASTPLLWFFVMEPHQKGRILGFLSPMAHATREGWHVRQSLAAVVSGGTTGNGFSTGSPVLLNRGFAAETDFIFAVVAHEWGFLGVVAIVLLLALFLSRGVEMAVRTREPFGRLVVTGMMTMLAFQACVNMGMTLGLCPITGLTLPFVSYGGSSLLTCFVMAAFVLNVGMRNRPVVAPEDF